MEITVHPSHQGQGIGGFLLAWVEERASQVIPEAQPDARVVLSQPVAGEDQATRQLFTQRGYNEATQNWQMRIDFLGTPSNPLIPPKIEIRPIRKGVEERKVLVYMAIRKV